MEKNGGIGAERCGIAWRVRMKDETASTNDDARGGVHGDVYAARFQTAGRGRIGHKWLAPPGANVAMSAVLSVAGLSAGQAATLPIAVGLAVARAVSRILPGAAVALKWPNDVLVCGRKVAGILCERDGDCVIAGVGINVERRAFPPELALRAAALADFAGFAGAADGVMDAVLGEMAAVYRVWRESGLAAFMPEIAGIDCLRGRRVAILQTDRDAAPLCGVCDGILPDGSLSVAGTPVYAGEAHVSADC